MKIAIVGAASLLGKELAEELASSSLAAAEILLLDEEEAAGQLTSVGDEAGFIARIDAGSFIGVDVVFFAGKAEQTAQHWPAVKRAGSAAVDLTFQLGAEVGAAVRAPWVAEALGLEEQIDLGVSVVIPAHPVAVMLGLLAARCTGLGLKTLVATVLLPASESGQKGLDEMHEQTVKLLSFQSLPQEEFDAQVAFNLLPSLGLAAKTSMEQTAQRILQHYRALGALAPLELQLVHAPVFHGFAASVLLDGSRPIRSDEVERSLSGDHIELISADAEAAGNVGAAGQGDVLVRVKNGSSPRIWAWVTADNLKLAAWNAIACGVQLIKYRPIGGVQ